MTATARRRAWHYPGFPRVPRWKVLADIRSRRLPEHDTRGLWTAYVGERDVESALDELVSLLIDAGIIVPSRRRP